MRFFKRLASFQHQTSAAAINVEPRPEDDLTMHCVLCLEPRARVEKLVAGREGSVCNGCVALAVDILSKSPGACSFCRTADVPLHRFEASAICAACAATAAHALPPAVPKM